MIPPHLIQAVKEATDLQVLAAEYTTLIRSGAQYLAICPSHKDSTPSCRIYQNHYFCFSCQAHGSPIDWVMLHEQCSFSAAVTTLAERAGISLDHKPVTRLQAAYAREEADYCKWWWEHWEQSLAECIHAHVAEQAYRTAGSLDRINAWMRGLGIADRIKVFREHRTDRDRRDYERWQREQADRFDIWFGFWESYLELRWGVSAR